LLKEKRRVKAILEELTWIIRWEGREGERGKESERKWEREEAGRERD
jgi:hypothetical protein